MGVFEDMNYPHVIETAVLLLFAFLLGATIGYFVRSLLLGPEKGSNKGDGSVAPPAEGAQTQPPVTAPLASAVPPAATVAPPPAPAPSSQTQGEKKKTAKKPAAKKTATKPAAAAVAAEKAAKPAKKSAAKAAPKPASKAKKTSGAKPASGDKSGSPAETGSPAPQTKPEGLDAPRGGAKDDLKRIKGVGPKIESTLNSMGIFHFDQIASWGRSEIEWVDENLSFKGRIDREKWVEQAKSLS